MAWRADVKTVKQGKRMMKRIYTFFRCWQTSFVLKTRFTLLRLRGRVMIHMKQIRIPDAHQHEKTGCCFCRWYGFGWRILQESIESSSRWTIKLGSNTCLPCFVVMTITFARPIMFINVRLSGNRVWAMQTKNPSAYVQVRHWNFNGGDTRVHSQQQVLLRLRSWDSRRVLLKETTGVLFELQEEEQHMRMKCRRNNWHEDLSRRENKASPRWWWCVGWTDAASLQQWCNCSICPTNLVRDVYPWL